MTLQCKYCDKYYSTQSSLNRHIREVHNIEDYYWRDYDNSKLFKCLEGCYISFRLNTELRMHLKLEHDIDVLEDTIEFDSEDDFIEWFTHLNASGATYLKRTSRISNDGRRKTVYFSCHRSGLPPKEKAERIRNLKSQGSCKSGTGCTSYIKLTVEGDKCTVNYSKFHYGHVVNELQHLHLPKILRTEVGQKLASRVTVTKIIDEHRDNITDNLTRANLLSRKDVINIKNSMKVQITEDVQPSDDAVFLQECLMDKYNPASRQFLIKRIKLELKELDKNIKKVHDIKVLSHIAETISNANILRNTETSATEFLSNKTKEPIVEIIEEQFTFDSTKMKKQIFKPSEETSENSGGVEFISNDSNLDHDYL